MKKIVLGLVFVAISQAVFAGAALEQEIERYIGIFSGDITQVSKDVYENLKWSGISNPKLYDVIEKRLLEFDTSESINDNKEQVKLLLQALTYSGNAKYASVLRKTAEDVTLKGTVRLHAKRSMRKLEQFERWNPQISLNIDGLPADRINAARIGNMIASDDTRLKKAGLDIIRKEKPQDQQLKDVALSMMINSDRKTRAEGAEFINDKYPQDDEIKKILTNLVVEKPDKWCVNGLDYLYKHFPLDGSVKKIMLEKMFAQYVYTRMKSVAHAKKYYARDIDVRDAAIRMMYSDDRQLNRYAKRLIRGNFEQDRQVVTAAVEVIKSYMEKRSAETENLYVVWLFDLIEKTHDPVYMEFLYHVSRYARSTKLADNAIRVAHNIRVKNRNKAG